MAKDELGNIECRVHSGKNFCCRLCHSNEYREMRGLYHCSGCAVIFRDPKLFSLTTEQVEAKNKNLSEISRLIDEHTKYVD